MDKNPHAVALGRLGGRARAWKTSRRDRQLWARMGGLARAARHRKWDLSRWGKMGGRPRGEHREAIPKLTDWVLRAQQDIAQQVQVDKSEKPGRHKKPA